MNETPQSEMIPFSRPDITEAEVNAVAQAVRSGWLTTGPATRQFESEFANCLGHSVGTVAVNSATAGLHLAVEALGLGPGDEVLVPTWTFTATAEVVRYVGATPVLVDIEPKTLNIDLNSASAQITDRTRAIIPVHFAGLPIPRRNLDDFARKYDLHVIEDAAHAFPAQSSGTPVGAGTSDATVFSFYASKTMTTGEGGMLVSSDERLLERARIMRLHGISRDAFDRYRSSTPSWHYDVVAPGFKYNLTDIASALGLVQLRRAHEMREARARIANSYTSAFADLPLSLPVGEREPSGHAWHLYVVHVDQESRLSRDQLIGRLSKAGIGTSVHFIPLHMQPYWRESLRHSPADFPAATKQFRSAMSLPLFSSMTDSQVDRVIETVRELLGQTC